MRRRRIPLVSQLSLDDCGAACLAMVLGYHGRHVPLSELREMTGTTRDGVDARGVVQAARHHGLNAHGVAADLDALGDLPPGSILHWEFRHFVVLERVRADGVDVVDPARGRRRVPMEAFRRSYTGVAIVCEPGPGFAPARRRRATTWRYLRPLLGERRILGGVVATSVLIRLLALALPVLTGVVVDRIVPGADRHLLWVVGLAMAAVVGYHVVASLVRTHLVLRLRTLLDVSLATGFVDHLVDLPYSFFLRRAAGDVLMRLQSISGVRDMLTSASLAALLDGGFGLLSLVVLAAISPTLAVIVLVLGAAQVAVSLLFLRPARDLLTEILDAEARAQSCAYEMLSG
ncbi:MAG: cysteine peptidase family C39 domain-containing protein, partial [Acidimicrobiia bacterium]